VIFAATSDKITKETAIAAIGAKKNQYVVTEVAIQEEKKDS